MSQDIQPAIRTELDERYDDMEIIERVGSDTRFERGLGDVGTVVELVDMSFQGGCPRCGEDEMVLSKDLGPYEVDGVWYCTNIKCPHFVADEVEQDMRKIRAERPHTWDNTAICPSCDTRHTVQLHRGTQDDGGIVQVMCEDCESVGTEADA